MARGQLPAASLHLLITLLDGEKHGYAMMREVEALSDGAVRMGAGTLYGTIKRLLGRGFIEEVDAPADGDAEDERRRYYRLTATGRRTVDSELERLHTLVTRARRLRPDFGRSLG